MVQGCFSGFNELLNTDGAVQTVDTPQWSAVSKRLEPPKDRQRRELSGGKPPTSYHLGTVEPMAVDNPEEGTEVLTDSVHLTVGCILCAQYVQSTESEQHHSLRKRQSMRQRQSKVLTIKLCPISTLSEPCILWDYHLLPSPQLCPGTQSTGGTSQTSSSLMHSIDSNYRLQADGYDLDAPGES